MGMFDFLAGPKPRTSMPENPYQRQQDELINQLRQQMQGPSVAESQYRQAAGNALGQQLAMSRGRNPGAARQAARAGGMMQQGMAAQGQQLALQERQGQLAQLAQVLQGAGGLELQRRLAELNAQMQAAQLPTGLDKLMQMGMAGGMIATGM